MLPPVATLANASALAVKLPELVISTLAVRPLAHWSIISESNVASALAQLLLALAEANARRLMVPELVNEAVAVLAGLAEPFHAFWSKTVC